MHDSVGVEAGLAMSRHARTRSFARSIPDDAILAARMYGREVHTRGAVLYVIGKKDVATARSYGEDIARCEGVHVVCSREDQVLTVYRNRNLRSLGRGHRDFGYTPPYSAPNMGTFDAGH